MEVEVESESTDAPGLVFTHGSRVTPREEEGTDDTSVMLPVPEVKKKE